MGSFGYFVCCGGSKAYFSVSPNRFLSVPAVATQGISISITTVTLKRLLFYDRTIGVCLTIGYIMHASTLILVPMSWLAKRIMEQVYHNVILCYYRI